MLPELKSSIEADKRWGEQRPEDLQLFGEIRYNLDAFLDKGTKHNMGWKTMFSVNTLNRTERDIDVEIEGDKYHLFIFSKNHNHRKDDIYVALLSPDRSRISAVAIPNEKDFDNGDFIDSGEQLLKNLDLIKKDVLPLIKNQVQVDWANEAGLTRSLG